MDKIKGENVMKNIKVIMCDIDGTLLNSKGIVTSKTIDAIKKFENKESCLEYQQEEMFQV